MITEKLVTNPIHYGLVPSRMLPWIQCSSSYSIMCPCWTEFSMLHHKGVFTVVNACCGELGSTQGVFGLFIMRWSSCFFPPGSVPMSCFTPGSFWVEVDAPYILAGRQECCFLWWSSKRVDYNNLFVLKGLLRLWWPPLHIWLRLDMNHNGMGRYRYTHKWRRENTPGPGLRNEPAQETTKDIAEDKETQQDSWSVPSYVHRAVVLQVTLPPNPGVNISFLSDGTQCHKRGLR